AAASETNLMGILLGGRKLVRTERPRCPFYGDAWRCVARRSRSATASTTAWLPVECLESTPIPGLDADCTAPDVMGSDEKAAGYPRGGAGRASVDGQVAALGVAEQGIAREVAVRALIRREAPWPVAAHVSINVGASYEQRGALAVGQHGPERD